MAEIVDNLSVGAMAMGYAVASLFFLRFWWVSNDRLFALFAMALLVLAVNRIAVSLLLSPYDSEEGSHFYWIRLAAFGLILIAIVDKNLPRRNRNNHDRRQPAA